MKTCFSFLILIAGSSAMIGCHSSEPTAQMEVQTASAHLVQSTQQDSPSIVRATGTLHAQESAAISAQVMGRVEQVLVQEGDSVRAGQPLVVLEDATLRAQAEQARAGVLAAEKQQAAAQAQAALAASTLERYKQLQAQKSVSPQEMDEVSRRAESAAAQVASARAQVDAVKAQESGAKAMLSYTHIHAPFAGFITARMADPGAMAAPGVPLLQLESAGPLQLQVSVDESLVATLHRGMKIAVSIDGAATAVSSGTVREILPVVDPASHSFQVKIDLPASAQLHAGMYGGANLATANHPAIVIPCSALVQRGSLFSVYALDAKGIAQLRSITLGAKQGDKVEVLSGLSANEKLIDQPGDRDFNGKRIEAQ